MELKSISRELLTNFTSDHGEWNCRAWGRTSLGFDSRLVSDISYPMFVHWQMFGSLWGSLGMKQNCGVLKSIVLHHKFPRIWSSDYKLLSSGEFNPLMCCVCGTSGSCFVEFDRSDSLNCKYTYLFSRCNVKIIFIHTNIKCSVCTRYKFHAPSLVDTYETVPNGSLVKVEFSSLIPLQLASYLY